MNCKKKTTSRYLNRPSPPYPANDCPGKTRKGNNGQMYVSTLVAGGKYYRWVPKKKKKTQKKRETLVLKPGLYENIKTGEIGFLGWQTKIMAGFVELYNPTNEGYCCGSKGIRHPAAGFYIKKTNARRLTKKEITPKMNAQWNRRIKQACGLVFSPTCRDK